MTATSTTPSADSGTRRTYFPALDGVRAVAVMVVVVAHGSVRLWPVEMRLRSGWVGVQMFFVLSGFLITYLLLAEKESTGRISLRDFYIRRGLRIWPLYYAVLAVYAFVLPRLSSSSFSGVFVGMADEAWPEYQSSLWPHVIFLQNYLVDVADVRIGLGVFWSLAVEEHFYLVWPLVVVLLHRRLLPMTLAGVVAAGVWFSAGYDSGFLAREPGWGEWTHTNMQAIAIGCAIGYAWAHHNDLFARIPERAAVIARGLAWTAIALVVVDGFAPVRGKLWLPSGYVLLQLTVIVSTAIVIIGVLASRDRPSRFLGQAAVVHLGRTSYGIYLTHILVLGVFAQAAGQWREHPIARWVAMLVFCWLTTVVADFLYRRFERPILQIKDRFQRF